MTAIRHDEPTTATLRADVAALAERIQHLERRYDRFESDAKGFVRRMDRHAERVDIVDRGYGGLRDRLTRLEEEFKWHYLGPGYEPTPPPAPAPDEGAKWGEVVAAGLNDGYLAARDKAIELNLAAPADRAVVVTVGLVDAALDAWESVPATENVTTHMWVALEAVFSALRAAPAGAEEGEDGEMMPMSGGVPWQ